MHSPWLASGAVTRSIPTRMRGASSRKACTPPSTRTPILDRFPCQLHNNLCYSLPLTARSAKRPASPPVFSFYARSGWEGGRDVVETTDRAVVEEEALPALQPRENAGQCPLPALPLQAAPAHAAAVGGNQHQG